MTYVFFFLQEVRDKILIMQGVCSMDVPKPVSLNLPVVQCRKDIQGGPSGCWKRNQELFLTLRSAVRQSEEH